MSFADKVHYNDCSASETPASNQNLSLNKSYFSLGAFTGLSVSPICLGTRHLSNRGGDCDGIPLLNEENSKDLVRTYMEMGGNFIDSYIMDGYGASQQFLGRFINDMQCREELVLATHVHGGRNSDEPSINGCGHKTLIRSLNRSLEKLQTEYVDLLWIDGWDGVTPARDLMHTLTKLVDTGLVLHLGMANVPNWYVAQCHQISLHRGFETISAVQSKYNLCNRNAEDHYFELCRQTGISFMPSAPLADGFLSGTQHYIKDHDLAHVETANYVLSVVEELSKQLNRPVAQIALIWALKRPTVSSLLMTPYSVSQLRSNCRCLDIELTVEQLNKLNVTTAAKDYTCTAQQLPPWWMQS